MSKDGMITFIKSEQYYKKSVKYRDEGDLKNALKYINKAIFNSCDTPDGYSVRAGIYKLMNDKDRCFADHEKAISLKDNVMANPFYWYLNRAGAYLHFGEYEKALDDCNLAIELAPHNKLSYQQRGHCYEGLGKPDLALADFKRAGYQEGIDKLEEI